MPPAGLIDQTTSLHRDFWNRRLSRPIINTDYSLANRLDRQFDYDKGALPDYWLDKDKLVLEPEMLVPELHHRFLEYESPTPPVCGPVFNTVFPWTLITWLPAIAGSRLTVTVEGQTIWPQESFGPNWYEEENLGLKPNWQWLEKLTEFTAYLVKAHHPRCAVGLEMFSRGPGDILLTTMGAERAYLAVYDHPDELRILLDKFADIHIKWARAQLAVIPPLEGGYCTQWGIWAPGTVNRIQEDFCINLSKKMFFEFIIPPLEKIVKAIDYHVFHTHSGAYHMPEWLTELEGLRAIECMVDPQGPSLEELIPIWNRVLEKKPLIITAPLTEEELRMLESNLQPNGLLLDVVLKPSTTQHSAAKRLA